MTDEIQRRKPESKRKTLTINLRVTKAEWDKLHELAKAVGKKMSRYLLDKALRRRS